MASPSIKIAWNGEKLIGDIEHAAERGIQAGAEILQLKIQTNISVVGPPHSTPGESPHLISGRLQGSVVIRPGKGTSRRVVVTAPYALHLEFGTVKMAPRPYIRRSMEEVRAEVTQTIVDEIKTEMK